MLPQFRARNKAREIFAMQGESGGLATLPTSLTINSTTVEPAFFYLGADGEEDQWPGVVGGTATEITDIVRVQYDSGTPHADDRLYGRDTLTSLRLRNTANPAVSTDDIVFEFVGTNPTVSNAYVVGWNPGQTIAVSIRFATGGRVSVELNDGVSSVSVIGSTTHTVGALYHVMAFLKRDGSVGFYSNGAADGAGVISSVSGSLTGTAGYDLGSRSGSSDYAGKLGLIAMWHSPAWLDTHLQAAVAWERYTQCAGVYSAAATADSAFVRASAAYMDKVSHVDGVQRLHYVGSGWHRYTRRYDDALRVGDGYFAENTSTNLCLQSQTLDTTWTKVDAGDTVDETNSEAPDGTTTMNLITGDATDGEHGVSQSITLTAAAHTMSVYAEEDSAGFLYLDVSTIANVSAYFDLAGGNVGTVGSAATAFMEYLGNDRYRCELRYTGTAAAHTHRVLIAEADGDKSTVSKAVKAWGVQVQAKAFADSYIPTTTGTVSRVADQLRHDASSLDLSCGTIICDVLKQADSANNNRLAVVSDDTDNNRILLYTDNTGDDPIAFVAAGGATQSNIQGTTEIATRWREVRTTWAANDFALYVDGDSEGTPDASGSIPAMDTLDIGMPRNAGADGRTEGLVKLRILSKPTKKNVTDFGALMAYGEISMVANATTTSITAGTPILVAGTTILGEAVDFTMPSNMRLRYDGTETKTFRVVAWTSFSGVNSRTVELYVAKNGTKIDKSQKDRRLGVGGDVGTGGTSALVQLANTDYVELFADIDTTDTPLFDHVHFSAVEVS